MDIKLKSSANVTYCCRTCMTGNSSLFNIFEDTIKSISIAGVLTSCTSLNIKKNDSLPQSICQLCFEKIKIFYEFRISAEEVDIKYRELLEDKTNISFEYDIIENNVPQEIKIENELLQDGLTISIKEESEEAVGTSDNENKVYVFIDNTNTKKESSDSDHYSVQKIESNVKARHDGKKHLCEICNKMFKSHNNYLRHTKKHLNNNKTKSDDVLHDNEFKGDEFVKCNVCGSVFKSLKSLSSHMEIHKNGKKLSCTINNESLKINIMGVMNTNSGDFQCEVCKCKFRTKHSVSAHMRKHAQKGRVLACSICGKIFGKISHLKRHEFSHKDKCAFKCGKCNKSYATEDRLQEHTKQHNNIKPHVCPVCQKAFINVPALNAHIKIHTRDKLYLCPTCGKRFDSSTNLNQHVRRHIGIKAFACSLCPKKFVSKGELKSHSITHTGERLYKCEQCKSSFTKHSSLVQHNLRHLGVKPHECDTCPMKFTTRSHLKRHYRIHTGEKPYKCDICERAFTQSNDLVKHRRGHLGDKIYKCNECTESFRLKIELREHISQHFVSQTGEQKGEIHMAAIGTDMNIITELNGQLKSEGEE